MLKFHSISFASCHLFPAFLAGCSQCILVISTCCHLFCYGELLQCYLVLKNIILGFDFLEFQSIMRFPTKNTIFLPVIQSTITKNSLLLMFYLYVVVFHPHVTGMYLVYTRMLLVFTRMYSYITRMYLYVTRMYSCGVLVTIHLKSLDRVHASQRCKPAPRK